MGMYARIQRNASGVKGVFQAPLRNMVRPHNDEGFILQNLRVKDMMLRQRVVLMQRNTGFDAQRIYIQRVVKQRHFTNSNFKKPRNDPLLNFCTVLRLKRDIYLRLVMCKFRNKLRNKAKGHRMLRGHLQMADLFVLQINNRLCNVIKSAKPHTNDRSVKVGSTQWITSPVRRGGCATPRSGS